MYGSFGLINPRKGTETIVSSDNYIARTRTFGLINPRKGTET